MVAGRARHAPKRWGGNVFLQVIDPKLFAGREAFTEQMDDLSERCRTNKPIHANKPVRLPGDQAALGIDKAQRQGLAYDQQTWQGLAEWAAKLQVALPIST